MTEREAGSIPAARLMEVVRAWRADEGKPVACPACGGEGTLEITDRSARPYREWYALSCGACGFVQTVSVALGAPVPGAD